MGVTIKKAVLWRKELENRPGTLASVLKPLAESGVNLQVVMGYALPGEHEHAAVEVWPIEGGKAESAASEAGLAASPRIACLIVTGDDAPGLGHTIAERLAANGINISFVMVQVGKEHYHGVFGFGSQEDADRAAQIITEAGKTVIPKRKPARKASAGKTARRGAAKKKSGARRTARGGAKKKGGARKAAASKARSKPRSKPRKRK